VTGAPFDLSQIPILLKGSPGLASNGDAMKRFKGFNTTPSFCTNFSNPTRHVQARSALGVKAAAAFKIRRYSGPRVRQAEPAPFVRLGHFPGIEKESLTQYLQGLRREARARSTEG